jgi:GMP synthase (glutamine-hydrolysing)
VSVLVLQHISCEPAAAYADVLRSHGVATTVVETDRAEWPLDWRPFDGVLAMGGPMRANDHGSLPWLAHERQLIRDSVRAGRAFFGVCLGAQLLAASLGAEVRPGPRPEIGVLPVFRTPEGGADPVLGRLPGMLSAFHWHGDTFELPDGAVLLASSAAYRNQAFRVGPVAYGVQFHLEASASTVASWAAVPEYRASLEHVGGARALPGLVGDLERHEPELRRCAEAVLSAWIEHCLVPVRTQQGKRNLRVPSFRQ